MRRLTLLWACCLTLLAAPAFAQQRLEFTRMIAHWDAYGDPGYVPFIQAARPQIVQVGFYGGHFWSLAHSEHGRGYPANFPVTGQAECGQFHEDLNAQIHACGARVVGHFNVKFLVGDPDGPEGPRGFFHFYRNLWDASELGPKPVENPLELLEVNAAGEPLVEHSYAIGGMSEYWGCLNNPHWKSVLKAWAKRGIERGVDGYMINYFYRHDCLCEHCQAAFRAYLADRFTAEELAQQFGIADLNSHVFPEIVAWHDPAQSTPLRREMLRFSQIANKRAFDEVFLDYGRSLKSDLIVGQWNHLGNFNQVSGDERCLLPADLWGRGEDYLWYSMGGAGCYTDLAQGYLGEATLQARYMRGAFDDKPFTFGKYEHTRIRVAIAEMAANGGAPMGFYTRFTDPPSREEIVRYYNFLERYEPWYAANTSHAEVVLLFPRSAVHAGDVAPVEQFRETGRHLLEAHVLCDVLPDDLATPERLAAYRHVVRAADDLSAVLADAALSRIAAPRTVRAALSRPAGGSDLTLHLVNYNRTEPAEPMSAGGGIQDEKPIAVSGIQADLRLPEGLVPVAAVFVTPEAPEPVPLSLETADGRTRFTVPEFLVYGVVQVTLKGQEDSAQ